MTENIWRLKETLPKYALYQQHWQKKGIIFLSLVALQESEEIMYLTNALGNEEDGGLTLKGPETQSAARCSAEVSDAVLLKGHRGRGVW